MTIAAPELGSRAGRIEATHVTGRRVVATIVDGLVFGYYILLEGLLGQTLGKLAVGRPGVAGPDPGLRQRRLIDMELRRLGQAAVALSGGYLAALAVTRRWHQHWGATDEEITKPLPGDDLIPAARLSSTHAITIGAPAERIWPWLVQMGYEDRAGSYSYDLFERSIGRNLYHVDRDIPPLAAHGTMPFYPGAPMTVAVADPPRALVLWQVTSRGKAIDPAGPWGEDHVVWSWAFALEPVDAATTRLLVRMRASYRPAARWAPIMWLLVEPAHFVMGRRQLLGIRQRVEATRPERMLPPATAGTEAAVGGVGARSGPGRAGDSSTTGLLHM